MLESILSIVAVASILTLVGIAVTSLVNFISGLFKKEKIKDAQKRQPQYTEQDVHMARYIEQQANMQKRHLLFRQLMRDATKFYDRNP